MRQIAILSLLFLPFLSLAQIKKVRVETYYISDSLDATDTTDFRVLEAGSSTYRIFVDLLPGSKIYKIYGDRYHKLKIKSSANFYNNINRPNAYFGYLINKSWFGGNPTLALDSWLTLGLATKTNQGILKKDDTDGSFIGGSFNGGGSSSIPGGILKNSDPSAGIPITVSDGLASFTGSFSQWSDVGFKDGSNIDTTVFGSLKIGSEFISNGDAYLQQSGGVSGFNSDSNSVLIAQLTTKGTIEFEFNLEVLNSDGSINKYVANDDTLLTDEIVSPFLSYPPKCGCTDPKFLEFKKKYSCSRIDSCKTRIVFGCMDTMACNYDSNANFNVEYLCCYPGYCNDRDLALVCPKFNSQRVSGEKKVKIYPNPSTNNIFIELAESQIKPTSYKLYNAFGLLIQQNSVVASADNLQIDISSLEQGLYLLQLTDGIQLTGNHFIKN